MAKKHNLTTISLVNKKGETVTVKNFTTKFRPFVLPIFALLTLNLVFSVALSVNQITKPNHSQQVVASNQTLLSNSTQTQSGVALLLRAMQHLQNTNNVTITSTGNTHALGTQAIHIKRMYDGSTHFMENIGTGLKNFANRIYYTKNYAVVRVNGTPTSNTTANWTGKVTNYSYEDFVNKFHITPNTFLPYDITALTILSTGPVTNTNDKFEFLVQLHPTLSTKQYEQSLESLGKVSSNITFQSVELKVTINQNQQFEKVESNEKFSVQMLGLTKQCSSHFTTQFNFESPAQIPTM